MQSLLVAGARQVCAHFLRQTRHMARSQERFLLNLLRYHQNTSLGRDYGLGNIHTVDRFRERVPVLPYSSYEPYIDRIARGEANILVPDPVVYLNMTSGSTGRQKLIPLTERSHRYTNRLRFVSSCFALDAAFKHGRTLGKVLVPSSIATFGHTSGGLEYGPVSVSHLRRSSALARSRLAYPFEALGIADPLARHYVCLLFSLCRSHLGAIGGNFPVILLELCESLEHHAEALIADVASGNLADWLDIEPALRSRLAVRLNPQPDRARQLDVAARATGRLTPIQAWPDLGFIITARGGTSDFYFERFPQYFGDTPIFGGIYACAETVFSTYYDFNQDSSILSPDAGFYEFVPISEPASEFPKTCLPAELEVGQQYRILATTYNGFYRYDIGDVVEVTGFCNQSPLIAFRHRRGGLLSSTTEKTTEFHATQVMQYLQHQFNLPLMDFCITLDADKIPPPYLVNIELPPDCTLDRPVAFIQEFDRHLQNIHASYQNKRRDVVPPPHLRVLAPGSFAAARDRLQRTARIPEGHLKFPHISDDRTLLAEAVVEQEVAALDRHDLTDSVLAR